MRSSKENTSIRDSQGKGERFHLAPSYPNHYGLSHFSLPSCFTGRLELPITLSKT